MRNLPSVATLLAQIESVAYPVKYAILNASILDPEDIDGVNLVYDLVYVSKEQDLVLAGAASYWSGVTELPEISEGITYWLIRV